MIKENAWPITQEAFLWGLGSICQINKIPFDAKLVLQQFPPDYTFASLQTAAHTLGFKTGVCKVTQQELTSLPSPCFAVIKNSLPVSAESLASNAANDEPAIEESRSLALIIKCDGKQLLFFKVGGDKAESIVVQEFDKNFEPHILMFTRAEIPVNDEDTPPKQFGFTWFVPALLKHKALWRDVLLASLVIQLGALATPLFTQAIIDKVVVHHTYSTLYVIAFALVVFMIFSAALTWVRQYLVLHTGNRVDAVLGTEVFEHIFNLPPRYFEHRATGVTVARIHGVETIREFITGAAVTLLLDFPFLLIFLAIMFYYNWLLSLIACGLLLIIAGLSVAITPTLRARLNQQFMLGARNQAFVTEFVSGFETVKALQMEAQVNKRYSDYFASYLQASFNTRQLSNTYNVIAHTLEQTMTLSILCVGAWLVMNNTNFTIGMLVAFQMFSSRLSQPVMRLVGLWQEFQQANMAVKRLGDIMNAPIEPYSLVPSRETSGRGHIEMRNVSFRYSDEHPYLYRELNLTLKPGQCIALMGPSGAGKSTLAKLLLGFYQPSDGNIYLDGRDIRHLSANELRCHFGVVPQETVLFSGSIYDNLILANPHATFEQVIQACKMAEIHETIEQLPQGYQTVIGEHGAGLSGGQKQRLAIARALLKRPQILLFDEATSSLDPGAAEQFALTINRLKSKVSVLFIAHQLPKTLKVDEVVALRKEIAKENLSGAA